jgi:hypothetical protein
MTAYVEDLRDPGSEGRAAVHYKTDTSAKTMSGEMPCVTCHTGAHTPKEAKR